VHASEKLLNVKQSLKKWLDANLAPGGEIEIDVFEPEFDPASLTSWIRVFLLGDIPAGEGETGASSKITQSHRLTIQVSIFQRLQESSDPYLSDLDTWTSEVGALFAVPRGITLIDFYSGGSFDSGATDPAWSENPSMRIIRSSWDGKRVNEGVYQSDFTVALEYFTREE